MDIFLKKGSSKTSDEVFLKKDKQWLSAKEEKTVKQKSLLWNKT